MISHAISRKVDMVRDVIREDKRFKDFIETFDDYEHYPEEYEDTYPQLLIEKKSNKKSNKKIRIKNNKGDFVDIDKLKNDSQIVELTPQEDDSNLIPIGTSTQWQEGIAYLKKVRKGRIKFKEFVAKNHRALLKSAYLKSRNIIWFLNDKVGK